MTDQSIKPREFWIDLIPKNFQEKGQKTYYCYDRRPETDEYQTLRHFREVYPVREAAINKLVEALNKIMKIGTTDEGNTPECMIAYEALTEWERVNK